MRWPDLGLRAVTGDIGLVMAAIRGLGDHRAAQGGAVAPHLAAAAVSCCCSTGSRAGRRCRRRGSTLLERLASGVPEELIAAAGPQIGLRGADEVAERARALVEDAETPPISALESAMLYDLLALETTASAALSHLIGISRHLPAIVPAVDRFAHRLDALAARGTDPAHLAFEASHGRSSMEYYDGFVFSFLRGRRAGGVGRALRRADRGAGTGPVDPGRGRRSCGRIWWRRLKGARLMVKIGVPSKGRLQEKCFDWFSARGLVMARAGSEREYAGRVAGADGRGTGAAVGRRDPARAGGRADRSGRDRHRTWCARSWPTGTGR